MFRDHSSRTHVSPRTGSGAGTAPGLRSLRGVCIVSGRGRRRCRHAPGQRAAFFFFTVWAVLHPRGDAGEGRRAEPLQTGRGSLLCHERASPWPLSQKSPISCHHPLHVRRRVCQHIGKLPESPHSLTLRASGDASAALEQGQAHVGDTAREGQRDRGSSGLQRPAHLCKQRRRKRMHRETALQTSRLQPRGCGFRTAAAPCRRPRGAQ